MGGSGSKTYTINEDVAKKGTTEKEAKKPSGKQMKSEVADDFTAEQTQENSSTHTISEPTTEHQIDDITEKIMEIQKNLITATGTVEEHRKNLDNYAQIIKNDTTSTTNDNSLLVENALRASYCLLPKTSSILVGKTEDDKEQEITIYNKLKNYEKDMNELDENFREFDRFDDATKLKLKIRLYGLLVEVDSVVSDNQGHLLLKSYLREKAVYLIRGIVC